MRQSRKRLKARALRAATNWLRPTHTLNKRECNERMVGAWLRGYEAARRDAAKTARKPVADWTQDVANIPHHTTFEDSATLTIPALGSRPSRCMGCGDELVPAGSNGFGMRCPRGAVCCA